MQPPSLCKFIQDLYHRAAVAFPLLGSIQCRPYYPRKQDATALQPSFKLKAHPSTPLGTRSHAPSQDMHVIRGSSQVKVCTEKDQAAYLGSSSYQSMVKLCGNKLLNGKECLQLNLQSTIKFPKSFY